MKIFIAIPTYDGKVPVELLRGILNLNTAGHSIGFGSTDGAHIVQARNGLAKTAVELGMDYLWFIDADQIIDDSETLVKLLSLDKDIVCSVIPDRNGEDHLCMVDDRLERIKEVKKDREVYWCGMGCTLIKIKVVKDILENPDLADPFDANQIDYEGEVYTLGEDYAFCHRARSMGYTIWAKHDSNPIHLGRPKRFKYGKGGIAVR